MGKWGEGGEASQESPTQEEKEERKEVKELGMASSSFLSPSLLFIPPAALLFPFQGGFFAWLKRGEGERGKNPVVGFGGISFFVVGTIKVGKFT